MRKILALWVMLALALASMVSPATAGITYPPVDPNIANPANAPAAIVPTGAEIIPCVQGGGVKGCTVNQTKTAVRYNNEGCDLGDSRAARSILIAGANYNMQTMGILNWVADLSKQTLVHKPSDIVGVSGYTSDQVLALLQTNLPTMACDTVFILVSTNDQGIGGYSAATSIGYLTQIETAVLNAGKRVVWLNEMPRGGSNTLTGTMLQAHLGIVSWINSRANNRNVFVIDSFGALVDPTTSGAAPLAGMFQSDQLHQDTMGAYTVAKQIVAKLGSQFAAAAPLVSSLADVYDATNNTRGVINANPLMTGTGGTKNAGAGTLTGTVADGYTATLVNGAGITCAGSQATGSDGLTWQQFVCSGTPTSAGPALQILATTAIQSSLAVGDVIEQVGASEQNSGQTGANALVLAASNSGLNRRDLSATTVTSAWPTDAISMVQRLGPFTASSTETSFYKPYFEADFLQNVAVSWTFRVRALSVRKISPAAISALMPRDVSNDRTGMKAAA